VSRRYHFLSQTTSEVINQLDPKTKKKSDAPRPSAWTTAQLQKWLQEHPLDLATKDESFFNCEIESYTRILTKTLHQTSKEGSEHATLWNNQSWESGLAANVRLINIITSDAYKEAFIGRDDKISISQLDAQGTEKETVSFWDQVQITFNDRNYTTESEILNADWGGRFFLKLKIWIGVNLIRSKCCRCSRERRQNHILQNYEIK